MVPEQPLVDIRLWSQFSRRIMAVLVATGFLGGGLLTVASIWKQNAQGREALERRGLTLARSLGRASFVPLVLEDHRALEALAEGFSEEADVVYVGLHDADGKILAKRSRDANYSIGGLKPPLPRDVFEHGIRLPHRPAVREVVLPLRYEAESAWASEKPVGYARIGLTEELLHRQSRAVIRDNVVLSLGLMLAAFLTGSILIRHMTRQMREFIEQVQASSELKRTNKELEAFSYSVSHDLRAPLRTINGFSHALLEDSGDRLDDTGKDYLKRVIDGCGQMGQLIDDLLGLSRVIRKEMRVESVDLTALAGSIAEQLAQSEPDRRVEFSAAKNVRITGDPGLLKIALENLIGNAWKFTRKTADARIEFGEMKKENARVFFVRDNGAGFDMAYVDKLFGPFQRLHEVTDFPGTGIGLATVHRIITRHGGRIWAEAAVQKGAAFYFTL